MFSSHHRKLQKISMPVWNLVKVENVFNEWYFMYMIVRYTKRTVEHWQFYKIGKVLPYKKDRSIHNGNIYEAYE